MSTDPTELRRDAARLVRQSLDMGEAEWVLSRADAEALLAAVRKAGREGMAGRVAGLGPVDSRTVRPEIVALREQERRERAPAEAARAEIARPEIARPEIARPAAAAPASRATPSGASGASSRVPLPVLPDDLDGVRGIAMECTRCGLAGSRTHVVFSDGVRDARLMVVGEAPGANEDETGLPFVGAAGKFLDLLLSTVDLSREESVYICNVLKCRPPGNRNPEPAEIEACAPFLLKQIELVRPEAILAVGSFSAQLLTGQEKAALGRLRGEVRSYQGVPLVVTYHPAALLRNGNWTRAFWDDLQLLREVLDQGAPASTAPD